MLFLSWTYKHLVLSPYIYCLKAIEDAVQYTMFSVTLLGTMKEILL